MSARRLFLFAATPLFAVSQSISFLPPAGFIGGGASVVFDCPHCIAIADFNGDGKPDIAYNTLPIVPEGGILLGNGDGAFRPPVPFPFFTSGSIFAGDFNGDGKADLIGDSVYLGNGDGSFRSPIPITGCTATLQLADFNRDGKTDLLCGTTPLLSNGDGTFTATGAAGAVKFESVALIADFNGDGIPDLLLLQVSGNLAVVLGHGDGAFGSEIPLSYGLHPQTTANFLAGDFNGDGKVDLIDFSQRGDRIDFLPGNGDGTFGSVIQTDISANPVPGRMSAVGDFNKDGKLDFVAGDSVYAGNGDGAFRFPIFFGPTTYTCGPARPTPVPFSCDYIHTSTTVGDFNGDGLPDLAAYTVIAPRPGGGFHEEAEIDVLLNDSPGNGFATAGVSSATGTWPVAPGSIVSAFGANLAPAIAIASTIPAPTTLGGIRLHVRDRSHSGDRLAPLLYVSPTQINYILNSSDPYAWVDIERVGAPYVPQGITVPIAAIAPGFFSAPYTASAPGYLSLYGTGFAETSAAVSSCMAGDADVPITYAGPEIQIAGLDQVNLLLPASLAGAGAQPVYCVFQTAQQVFGVSNIVKVVIR